MYNISYIFTTRNRLPFLRITLFKLMESLLTNEEIIVVDGNSSDGATKFLQELYDTGKIHQFISEPDRNQAHGWNKALLMARGTIIKKIIDDDVYDYRAIRKCADYMIGHPDVDVMISNNLSTALASTQKITAEGRLSHYEKWRRGETICFTFSDVYMLIRKSSLSYIGLYDTQFVMLDWEYSLRCSYLRANIVYYSGYNTLTVSTPGNVTSATTTQRLKSEGRIGMEKYGYKGDRSDISLYSELKIAIGKAVNYRAATIQSPKQEIPLLSDEQLPGIYNQLYQYLENYNDAGDFKFITE